MSLKLSSLNIKEIKDIGTQYGIVGLSKYNKSTRKELINVVELGVKKSKHIEHLSDDELKDLAK